MSGKVVHFEIPFDDGERAREFYREAFGWHIVQVPDVDYTMVSSGPVTDQGVPAEPGFINGGMVQRGTGAAVSPVLVIEVGNIDDALANVEKLGGSIVITRTAVGSFGYSAYFTDPEGNTVGLWESAGL
jgi:uncharacterized protein